MAIVELKRMDITLQNLEVCVPGRAFALLSIRQFEIPFGSRILIEGASGLGKSTLLNVMGGLSTVSSGMVTVGEYELHKMGESARSKMRKQHFGILFQRLNLIPHLTALENVVLVLFSKESREQIAREALSRVGLAQKAHLRSSVLSLGEQQRVAAARLLAAAPSILLADEPTSSLDAKNAEKILDYLWQASEGKTLVLVSHDERVRQRFSQRVQLGDLLRS